MTKKLAKPIKLSLANPAHVQEFAIQLSSYIEKNNLYTIIQGKKYVNVDGWKFAGSSFGVTCIVDEPVLVNQRGETLYMALSNWIKKGNKSFQKVLACTTDKEAFDTWKKENKFHSILMRPHFVYRCSAQVLPISGNSKRILSTGFAVCSNTESKKREFDEYALMSMAQTRAIGKAYRNLIGFLMSNAGFEGTPAEEMEEVENYEEAQVIEEEVRALTDSQWEKFKESYKTGDRTMEDLTSAGFGLTDKQKTEFEILKNAKS